MISIAGADADIDLPNALVTLNGSANAARPLSGGGARKVPPAGQEKRTVQAGSIHCAGERSVSGP